MQQDSDDAQAQADFAVSILIRPEGRMQPGGAGGLVNTEDVSILIRPEGRMQLQRAGVLAARTTLFQSSSGQKAGCNVEHHRISTGSGRRCFNPHPARRPDATGASKRPGCGPKLVSILIRPEGRMQRLYLNFLSVLREPPDASLPICFIAPIISFLQLRFSYEREPPGCNGLPHWVRVRPPAVP